MSKKKEKEIKVSLIKDINEDTNQVKKLILILLLVAIVSYLLYFVTAKFLIKDDFQNEESTTETVISYNEIKVGNVFNRPYDEYYVFAYESEDNKASYYNALLNNYASDEKNNKIYFLDLSLDINKTYLKEKSNKKATTASELSFNGPTLLKISKQKISGYYDSIKDIEAELK